MARGGEEAERWFITNGCEFSLRGDGHTLELVMVMPFGFAELIKNH